MDENDEPMTYKPGEFMHCTIDGVDAVIYLSMIFDDPKDRRFHCYRYAAPYSPEVPKDASITIFGPVDTSEDPRK